MDDLKLDIIDSFSDEDMKTFKNMNLMQERANSQKYQCLNKLEKETPT